MAQTVLESTCHQHFQSKLPYLAGSETETSTKIYELLVLRTLQNKHPKPCQPVKIFHWDR